MAASLARPAPLRLPTHQWTTVWLAVRAAAAAVAGAGSHTSDCNDCDGDSDGDGDGGGGDDVEGIADAGEGDGGGSGGGVGAEGAAAYWLDGFRSAQDLAPALRLPLALCEVGRAAAARGRVWSSADSSLAAPPRRQLPAALLAWRARRLPRCVPRQIGHAQV